MFIAVRYLKTSTITSFLLRRLSPLVGKNLCWVTKTCVTIKYMTRDGWGWICSILDDYSCAAEFWNSSRLFTQFRKKKNEILPRILVVLRQTFKDILQVTLNVFLAFMHAWNMLQMCICRPDIIIMHIFYSTKRFKKQIFQTLSLTTKKIIVNFVILFWKIWVICFNNSKRIFDSGWGLSLFINSRVTCSR